MLILYQFEVSPFCNKIRRLLNVKKVPYETREVGLLDSQLGFKRLNPAGKVPALVDDAGSAVCDSTEIAYYLESRYPEPALLPKDPREAALVHVLEDWADESLYFYNLKLRFGFAHNRAKVIPKLLATQENPIVRALGPFLVPLSLNRKVREQGIGKKSAEQVRADLERHLGSLAALLTGREFLVGASLTLADIAVFAQLSAIRETEEGSEAIRTATPVEAFLDKVDAATSQAPQ